MTSLLLELTLPPSVNRLWAPIRTATGARLVKRAAYRQWSAAAAREVLAQRAGVRILGAFGVTIRLPESRGDGDNLIKALLDACQAGGAILDDRHCRRWLVERDPSRRDTALIEITPIPAAAARARADTGPRAQGATS
ncbi:RusA family crossover junction endodeoxyribonuclease [Crenalkalicoccus roseus]|uniref:RusA family crossover junction endodeoxyribonuclease n=1 Tax=Crenalkalicoccus roseus TaxID=1485588 RepID=UPI0010805552|nr:RusA family crossover junction endodeoxyribonuclease [Crenalkalicoccus roseus]